MISLKKKKKNQNFPSQGRVMSQVTEEITEREAQKEKPLHRVPNTEPPTDF